MFNWMNYFWGSNIFDRNALDDPLTQLSVLSNGNYSLQLLYTHSLFLSTREACAIVIIDVLLCTTLSPPNTCCLSFLRTLSTTRRVRLTYATPSIQSVALLIRVSNDIPPTFSHTMEWRFANWRIHSCINTVVRGWWLSWSYPKSLAHPMNN